VSARVIESEAGTIEISAGALSQLVVQAAEGAVGARVRRPRRGLEIAVEGDRVRVELELAARVGVVLPDVARDVQERVTDALQRMCGLSVEAVDVSVEELDDR
jgi:uncharacterized alkaline shock family protein YloU